MASKPYFSMLDNWLHKGVINDPYNEFMIVEDKEIAKDNAKDDFNDKYPFFGFFFILLILFFLMFFCLLYILGS